MNLITAAAVTAVDPWGPWPLGTGHAIAMAVSILVFLIVAAYSEARSYEPGGDSDAAAARIRRPFAIAAAAVTGTFFVIALPIFLASA